MPPHRALAFGSLGAAAESAAVRRQRQRGGEATTHTSGWPSWPCSREHQSQFAQRCIQLFWTAWGHGMRSATQLRHPGGFHPRGWEMEGWQVDAGPIFLFLSDNREEGKRKQNCIWRPSCQLVVSRRNNQVIISAALELKTVFSDVILYSFFFFFFNITQVWWQLQQDNKWQERTFQVHNHLNQ